MNSKEIEKVIRDAVRQSRCGLGSMDVEYQYSVEQIIAAAINSLQEPVTICNELGDKPKSAQEVTDQESPSTPSEEEWKEALEARIKNTKANLREAHLIKIGAEWAKKFLNE
jgi:hypothetical protein